MAILHHIYTTEKTISKFFPEDSCKLVLSNACTEDWCAHKVAKMTKLAVMITMHVPMTLVMNKKGVPILVAIHTSSVSCDDYDACTYDECNPYSGCSYTC